MEQLIGADRPDFDALIHPKTETDQEHADVLRETYKLDPEIMKEVDELYGPLEWRLPETHAIYWAYVGKQNAKTKEDLIMLRRVIYQSMYLAFHRGRLIRNEFNSTVQFGPNLDIIPHTHAAFEQAMEEDEQMREHISRAHKNFLLDAVYFLFVHNRMREAEQWLGVVKEKYPDDYPEQTTLEDYALSRVGEDASETDMNKTISNIAGALRQSYVNLALGEDDQAEGLTQLARVMWRNYMKKIGGGPSDERVGLPPLAEIGRDVLGELLDPQTGLLPEMAAALRTRLGLPADYGAAPTNAPPATSTPAPPG
jgi:hypothetical protein